MTWQRLTSIWVFILQKRSNMQRFSQLAHANIHYLYMFTATRPHLRNTRYMKIFFWVLHSRLVSELLEQSRAGGTMVGIRVEWCFFRIPKQWWRIWLSAFRKPGAAIFLESFDICKNMGDYLFLAGNIKCLGWFFWDRVWVLLKLPSTSIWEYQLLLPKTWHIVPITVCSFILSSPHCEVDSFPQSEFRTQSCKARNERDFVLVDIVGWTQREFIRKATVLNGCWAKTATQKWGLLRPRTVVFPYFCGPLSAACSPKVGTCIAGIAVGISPLDASSFQRVKVTRNFDRRNLKIYCFRFGSFVSTWLKNWARNGVGA